MNKSRSPLKNRLKHQKVSPLKLRRLANLIRNKDLNYSIQLLSNLQNKGSLILKKLIINTINNAGLKSVDEYSKYKVFHISIDEGKKQKKVFPRARSRMDLRVRKLSHINLEIAEG